MVGIKQSRVANGISSNLQTEFQQARNVPNENFASYRLIQFDLGGNFCERIAAG